MKVDRQFAPKLVIASSCLFPAGEPAGDILNDLNEKIASSQASMKAKKPSTSFSKVKKVLQVMQ